MYNCATPSMCCACVFVCVCVSQDKRNGCTALPGSRADSRQQTNHQKYASNEGDACLAEETEMTCNKTQRRTHGAAKKKGGAEREREYWGLSCPPPVDYNTKWHLTTEIYLANASPETFTEITIAKLACLAEQAETERQRGSSRRPAAAGQSQTALAT